MDMVYIFSVPFSGIVNLKGLCHKPTFEFADVDKMLFHPHSSQPRACQETWRFCCMVISAACQCTSPRIVDGVEIIVEELLVSLPGCAAYP